MSTENPRISHVLSYMTKCPICLDDCVDPRSLPCLHAFCLGCLQSHCRQRLPGDAAECPVCRKEFRIPDKGIDDLPHNFFVESLVSLKTSVDKIISEEDDATCGQQVARSTDAAAVRCECCGEETGRRATVYCADCREKLCESCAFRCQKRNSGTPHRVEELPEIIVIDKCSLMLKAGKDAAEAVDFNANGTPCQLHSGCVVEFYCVDCKVNVCAVCRKQKHGRHECSNIADVAAKFADKINVDIRSLSSAAADIRGEQEKTAAVRKDFLDKIDDIETQMKQKGEELKALIDVAVGDMLRQVEKVKAELEKQLNSYTDQMELVLAQVESFVSTSQEIIEKGLSSDITRSANELASRASELHKMASASVVGFSPPEICFLPADTARTIENIGDMKLMVGQLQSIAAYRSYSAHPRLLSSVSARRGVWGVAHHNNNNLYVVCRDSSAIHVFGPDGKSSKDILIDGLKSPQDIVACAKTNQLYISDYSSSGGGRVWRIPVAGGGKADVFLPKTWSKRAAEYSPATLSVTSGRLLVTSYVEDDELRMYDSDGTKVRRISLQSGIAEVGHARETARGTIIVSHRKPKPQISEVYVDGRVVRTYSGHLELNNPWFMAMDSQGRVFVADCNNDRIILLNARLELERVLLEKEKHELVGRPSRLCYVEKSTTLIVSSCLSGCVDFFNLSEPA